MKKDKNFIFLNQVTGYLFIDVINAFATKYNSVLLAGQITENNTLLAQSVKRKKLIKYNRDTSIKRIFTWFVFTLQSFFRLLFISKKDTELFIVTNPPFSPYIGYLIYKIKGIPYHLLIYDVYPDALLNFGMIKQDGFINKTWKKLNTKIYKNASTIFTLSNNMGMLIKQYDSNAKVQVIPNWADTAFIKPLNKEENSFAKQYDQADKLTIMYSGNMGATHAVEKIADLAKAYINDSRFGFMLIGEGAKKKALEQLKQDWALNNLIILPYQDSATLPQSLACADIGIVTLSSGAEDLSVPSKTYNLLAAGVILLVIASPTSELSLLVEKYECGKHFQEHEAGKMIDFISGLYNNAQRQQFMKANARRASADFTPENAFLYEGLLNSNKQSL